jgi:hypothetical protein
MMLFQAFDLCFIRIQLHTWLVHDALALHGTPEHRLLFSLPVLPLLAYT